MKNIKKIITSLVMFTSLSAIVMTFTSCSFNNYETLTYEINEGFKNIAINTNTADISFLPTDEDICKVSCYENQKIKHIVSYSDDTLSIEVDENRKWYDYIFNFSSPKITIYLPEKEYSSLYINESTGDLDISNDFTFDNIDISVSTGNIKCLASTNKMCSIRSTTGNIYLEDVTTNYLDLSCSTGKINASKVNCYNDININVTTGKTILSDITCNNLITNGSTGNVSLDGVISKDRLYIERSTGNVEIQKSDASKIFIKTTTGNVSGTLLTDKTFIAKSSTGRINVPKDTTGGKCEITTSTGNINISISKN